MYEITRYHDISAGHRVVGHESKCRFLHGHNYRIHFTVVAEELDEVGRVIDFGVVKQTLCEWLESNWDHKFLIWIEDNLAPVLPSNLGICFVPFNPTAENMAEYLVSNIGPALLSGTGIDLKSVRIDETRKCSATYTSRKYAR